MSKNIKIIGVILFVFIFTTVTFTQGQNPGKTPRQLAVEKLKKELQEKLNARLGYEVSVETYLKAMDYLSHGELDKAKNIALEQGMKEFFTIVLRSNFAAILSWAWDFDKWVWQSVQNWADNRDKKIFMQEFLKPLMTRWHKEKWFGEKKPYTKEFIKKLTEQFDNWFIDKGYVRSQLYINSKTKFKKFKNDAWNMLLIGAREIAIHTRIREAAEKAQIRLRQMLNKYQQEFMNIPEKKELPNKYLTNYSDKQIWEFFFFGFQDI